MVARQLGKVCLVGCRALSLDEAGRAGRIGQEEIRDGDWLSLDGYTGEISLGQRAVVTERPETELAEVERWRAGAKGQGAYS